MKNEPFSITKRLKSFGYAFNGLKILIKEEHNARIHAVATIFVVVLGAWLDISTSEWIALIFAIGFVFAMETVNSAIENLADFITKEKQDAIKKVKDLAASAVLISAICALIVGLVIFIPKILKLC
ncbi:MAG: diacylglycerol kinase family protein [Raineya sp.]|jgi:diacylglycerol kinase|nr:diacylglycerol kinase family protein [Raineya sp.]